MIPSCARTTSGRSRRCSGLAADGLGAPSPSRPSPAACRACASTATTCWSCSRPCARLQGGARARRRTDAHRGGNLSYAACPQRAPTIRTRYRPEADEAAWRDKDPLVQEASASYLAATGVPRRRGRRRAARRHRGGDQDGRRGRGERGPPAAREPSSRNVYARVPATLEAQLARASSSVRKAPSAAPPTNGALDATMRAGSSARPVAV